MKPFAGIFAFWLAASSAAAADFVEDVERVIPLRSSGRLEITNNRGDVVIDGWSQDKVRIRARRKASAETDVEARRLFDSLDFRHQAHGGNIEISAEYGRGLTLEERLKERSNPRTSMEMALSAPTNMPLRVWTVHGKVIIRGWKSSVEVRSTSGPIEIEGVRGSNLGILCPQCPVRLKEIRGSVRVMGGGGPIVMSSVAGASIYIETEGGSVTGVRISGDQLYLSKSGALDLQATEGRVEFHTLQGPVSIKDGAGFVSGSTLSGNISCRMSSWAFEDKALIESRSGRIELSLPREFSGELDLKSAQGKLRAEGVIRMDPRADSKTQGTQTADASGNRLSGRVGNGGELLKVASDRGDVTLRIGN